MALGVVTLCLVSAQLYLSVRGAQERALRSELEMRSELEPPLGLDLQGIRDRATTLLAHVPNGLREATALCLLGLRAGRDTDLESLLRHCLYLLPRTNSLREGAAIAHASLSPSGQLIALATVDDRADALVLATGEQLAAVALDVSDERFVSVQLADSVAEKPGLLLAVPVHGDLEVWSLGSESERLFSLGDKPDLRYVALLPLSRLLVISAANGLRVWSADYGFPLATLDRSGATAAVETSAGPRLAASNGILRADVLDEHLNLLWTAEATEAIAELYLSARNGALLVKTVSGRLQLFAEGAASPRRNWEDAGARAVALSPDGRTAWTRGSTVLVDGVALSGHLGPVDRLCWSPDEQYLATGSVDGSARLWRVVDGREVMRVGHGSAVTSVAFLSERTLVSTGLDGRVLVSEYKPEAQDPLHVPIRARDVAAEAAISPDGRRLLVTRASGPDQLWDLSSVQHTALDPPGQAPLGATSSPDFSPDGTLVARGGRQGVALYDVGSAALLRILDPDRGVIRSKWSPSGSRLATVDYETNIARVLDVPSGALLGELPGRGPGDGAGDQGRFRTSRLQFLEEDALLTVDSPLLGRRTEGLATIWRNVGGANPGRVRLPLEVMDAVASAGRVVTLAADGRLSIWTDTQLRWTARDLGLVGGDRLTMLQELVVLAWSQESTRLRANSLEAGDSIWEADLVDLPVEVVAAPAAGRFAVCSRSGSGFLVEVRSAAEGRSLLSVECGSVWPAFGLTEHGTRLFLAARDYGAAVWNVDLGEVLTSHADALKGVAEEMACLEAVLKQGARPAASWPSGGR